MSVWYMAPELSYSVIALTNISIIGLSSDIWAMIIHITVIVPWCLNYHLEITHILFQFTDAVDYIEVLLGIQIVYNIWNATENCNGSETESMLFNYVIYISVFIYIYIYIYSIFIYIYIYMQKWTYIYKVYIVIHGICTLVLHKYISYSSFPLPTRPPYPFPLAHSGALEHSTAMNVVIQVEVRPAKFPCSCTKIVCCAAQFAANRQWICWCITLEMTPLRTWNAHNTSSQV